MITAATVLCWVLVGSIAAQGLMALGFVAALRRWKRRLPPDEDCPKTAVVLCLRGLDPFLDACIKAVLNQDYPRYDVHVVVDRRDDPAWREVERIAARCGGTRLRMEPLVRRRETCSLKCSSLSQAVAALDDSYEVVALLDADTIPHRTWLRELVAPLADPRVGAATGNRWYMPVSATWASLVRYLWNAAAVVQMYCYGIPWGGTLAVKRRVLQESGLLERWQRAFCEDTMLYRALRQRGLRVAFVPSLMMVNRETCRLGGMLRWLQRQLLTARLYHPGWPAVVLHGFSTPLVLAAAAALVVAAMFSGQGEAAARVGAGLAIYLTALPVLLALMESSVRRIVRARGEPTAWLSVTALAKTAPAILLTQAVYPASLLTAAVLRDVEWRGARYRVDGPWQVRLIEDRPDAAPRDALASL